ncbi:MAG: DUF2807 domain-containing protein [Verrucomicrobia bacterium]|nr:DUF2807 domain-containing protein [Verrucomicrobiota bacterium]
MNNDQPLPHSLRNSMPGGFIGFTPALALLICIALALASAGCGVLGVGITGSGTTVTKEYELAGFSRLAVGNAFQVEVTQGPKHSVAVTVDDNLVEYLDVSKSGDALRIKLQPQISVRHATMKAAVTMPELTGLDLSGAVRASLTGFSSDNPLDAELSGASHLRGDIKSGDARFDVSGASRVELRGNAKALKITASGASHANFDEYQSGETTARASGASRITVAPSGNLDADASGASTVSYTGEPRDVKAHTSGASSVRRK